MSAALPSAEPDASVIETSVANAARDRKYGRRVLNQYDVFGEIGRGMHGIVRHGIDTTTGEDVVSIAILPYLSISRRCFFAHSRTV